MAARVLSIISNHKNVQWKRKKCFFVFCVFFLRMKNPFLEACWPSDPTPPLLGLRWLTHSFLRPTHRRKTGLKIVGPTGIPHESGRGRQPTKKDLRALIAQPHPPLGVAPRDLSQPRHPLLGAGASGDAGSTATLLQVSLPGPSL